MQKDRAAYHRYAALCACSKVCICQQMFIVAFCINHPCYGDKLIFFIHPIEYQIVLYEQPSVFML